MLYLKIRKHWNTLHGNKKDAIMHEIGQLLSTCNENIKDCIARTFMNRLILAYFNICCKFPNGIEHYLDFSLKLYQSISTVPFHTRAQS